MEKNPLSLSVIYNFRRYSHYELGLHRMCVLVDGAHLKLHPLYEERGPVGYNSSPSIQHNINETSKWR